MEIHKASIHRDEDRVVLSLSVNDDDLEITLTDDDPNAVKDVFNELIIELKKGEFNFELEDPGEDLYFYICDEYVNQLNSELSSVYHELINHDMLAKEEEI